MECAKFDVYCHDETKTDFVEVIGPIPISLRSTLTGTVLQALGCRAANRENVLPVRLDLCRKRPSAISIRINYAVSQCTALEADPQEVAGLRRRDDKPSSLCQRAAIAPPSRLS